MIVLQDIGVVDPAVVNFFQLPVAGAIGYYEMATSGPASVRNWVNAALPLTQVGTPVAAAQGLTLSGVNYFDTGLAEPTGFTLFLVAKLNTLDGSTALLRPSRWGGRQVAGGTFLYYEGSGGNALKFNGTGLPALNLNDAALSSWHCLSVAVNPTEVSGTTGRATVTNHTSGVTVTNTFTTSGRTPAVTNMRLGWGGSTGYTGPLDMWRAGIWNRGMSAAERTTMLAFLRAEAAALAGPTF